MSQQYPENPKAVMFTNVDGSDTNVMVFTSLDAGTIEKAYRNAPHQPQFDEVYEVPEQDVPYYLYEPCWLTIEEEERARQLAASV